MESGEDAKGLRHAIAISPHGEKDWKYYDCNYPHWIKEPVSDQQLLDLLIASFYSFPRTDTMTLSINILNFKGPRHHNTASLKEIETTFKQSSPCGWTPLHKAQFARSAAPTTRLLSDSTNKETAVFALDKFKNTPLHLAVHLQSEDKIEALLSPLEPDIQHQCLIQKDERGFSPFLWAVIHGSVGILKKLLCFGVKDQHSALKSQTSNTYKLSAQHYLGMHTPPVSIELYKVLTQNMSHSQYIQWLQQKDQSDCTIFHHLSQFQNLPLLQKILQKLTPKERKAFLTSKNKDKRSPINIAEKNPQLYTYLTKSLL